LATTSTWLAWLARCHIDVDVVGGGVGIVAGAQRGRKAIAEAALGPGLLDRVVLVGTAGARSLTCWSRRTTWSRVW
jgi:hypothetical protein